MAELDGQPGVAVLANLATSGALDYLIHLEAYNLVTRAPLQAGNYGSVWA